MVFGFCASCEIESLQCFKGFPGFMERLDLRVASSVYDRRCTAPKLVQTALIFSPFQRANLELAWKAL